MSDFLFLPSHPSVSSAHYAAMKPLWEMLANAGQKALTVTILDLPWNHQCYDAYHSMVRHIRRKDGSWTFDYRVFDEYVAFGRSCGIGPWIACYTMCPWDYAVCCGPEHPNTMCANELEEAFWLGVYPAMAGLDGFLRWAWNSWPQDPIRDASCTGIGRGWPAGDTFLVYPDGSPSLRFLELRNGIVAAEKFRILKEQDALKKNDFASLPAKFDRKAAMENTCDFAKLRSSVQKLVNKGR